MKKPSPDNQEPLFPSDSLPGDPDAALKAKVSKKHAVDVVRPGEKKKGREMQGFTQMDTLAHDSIWKLNMKNPTAVSILHYMMARMSRKATAYIASAATLAAEMGVSARTVQTSIQMLKQYNFVQILKSGNTNVYVINSHVAWRGERGSRSAIFHSITHVTEKEQDVSVEELEEENARLQPVPDMSMLFSPDMIVDMATDLDELEDGVERP
jgi:DNA-binding transcriptional regulator YhcF (GntR family)